MNNITLGDSELAAYQDVFPQSQKGVMVERAKNLHVTQTRPTSISEEPHGRREYGTSMAGRLIGLSSLQKQNEGYTFLLCIIDVLFKYAWVIPLKNKSGALDHQGFCPSVQTSP